MVPRIRFLMILRPPLAALLLSLSSKLSKYTSDISGQFAKKFTKYTYAPQKRNSSQFGLLVTFAPLLAKHTIAHNNIVHNIEYIQAPKWINPFDFNGLVIFFYLRTNITFLLILMFFYGQ